MNQALLLMLASIIATLVAVPFLLPTAASDLTPTGALIMGVNETEFESYEIPAMEREISAPDKVEKEIRTPYWSFWFAMENASLKQKLIRLDKVVELFKNATLAKWSIASNDWKLQVRKGSDFIAENFSCPDGELNKLIRNGESELTWQGSSFERINQSYNEAKSRLDKDVMIMEQAKLRILGQVVGNNVVINEFEANPEGNDTNNEWIELFNPTFDQIEVSGYEIKKLVNGNETTLFVVPNGTTLAPFEFLVITDLEAALNNDDLVLVLYDVNSNEIDRTPSLSDDQNDNNCWARVPNGIDTNSTSDWKFVACTKGDFNPLA